MTRSIRYAITRTSLGPLLVAASERGVCRVRFGDDEQALAEALHCEFGCARLERDAVGLAPWVEAVVACVEGRSAALDVPLDVSASRFRERVWDALRAIPRGQTRSYAELARSLGVPRGARAVAQACAANPVAVVIPCHRVVESGGGLGGYRWGVARKRALLAREGAQPQRVAAESASNASTGMRAMRMSVGSNMPSSQG